MGGQVFGDAVELPPVVEFAAEAVLQPNGDATELRATVLRKVAEPSPQLDVPRHRCEPFQEVTPRIALARFHARIEIFLRYFMLEEQLENI